MITSREIRRIAASVVVRRLTLLALAALLAWLGFGEARAQSYPNCNGTLQAAATCPDIATAQSMAVAANQYACANISSAYTCTGVNPVVHASAASPKYFRGSYNWVNKGNASLTGTNQGPIRYYDAGCPAGTTWNDTLLQCVGACPAGAVRMANGQCSPTPEQCQAHNAPGGGFLGQVTNKTFQSHCIAGCTLSAVPGTGAGWTTINGNTVYNSEFLFSGETCGQTPPPVFIPGTETVEEAKQKKPQECVAAGSGQSMCVKINGDHCYTASTGKQICWKPGEVGDKGDGPTLQVRNPGNTPNAPNLTLPTGDTLSQQGTPMTATTSRPGSITTTTTTNYVTANGTNATPGQSGEPDNGAGGSNGDDDEEENSASGGENCDSPPIVSGDQILGMVANQAWATRCAVEAGNAASVTGDVGDCKSAFSVEGSNANAVKLRAMRAQICGDEDPDGPFDAASYGAGVVDGVAGEGEPGGAFTDGTEGGGGDGNLDTSGLGYSRSCPTLPSVTVMGNTIDFNAHGNVLCDWISLGGQMVLLLAALLSLRIIASAGTV